MARQPEHLLPVEGRRASRGSRREIAPAFVNYLRSRYNGHPIRWFKAKHLPTPQRLPPPTTRLMDLSLPFPVYQRQFFAISQTAPRSICLPSRRLSLCLPPARETSPPPPPA